MVGILEPMSLLRIGCAVLSEISIQKNELDECKVQVEEIAIGFHFLPMIVPFRVTR